MNKINCIIVDDEISGRIVVRELLTRFCEDVTIVGEAANIKDAYTLIKEKKPDLVLLDVQMPGGDGFDLLRKFDEINFDIVFVTSYDKYAINAIKFSALDYLLKPIELGDLRISLEKVRQRKNEKETPRQWVINLLNNLEEHNPKKSIAIHHQDKVRLVKLADIVCLEAESNYTHIFTIDNERFTPARVLRDFEEYLESYTNFMRINKKVIVNLDYITGYSKGEPHILFLKNGKEYEIGRRKRTELASRVK